MVCMPNRKILLPGASKEGMEVIQGVSWTDNCGLHVVQAAPARARVDETTGRVLVVFGPTSKPVFSRVLQYMASRASECPLTRHHQSMFKGFADQFWWDRCGLRKVDTSFPEGHDHTEVLHVHGRVADTRYVCGGCATRRAQLHEVSVFPRREILLGPLC